MAVLLLKVDFFDSYALPLKGDIEVQAEDGSNTDWAPGIIVIQDTVSGEDGLETEGLQDNKDDRINKAAQEKQTGKDVPLQDSSQGAAGEESCGMFEITGYCSCELCTGKPFYQIRDRSQARLYGCCWSRRVSTGQQDSDWRDYLFSGGYWGFHQRKCCGHLLWNPRRGGCQWQIRGRGVFNKRYVIIRIQGLWYQHLHIEN